jgi:hypothetical protein
MSWIVLLVYVMRFVLLTHAALKEIGASWRDIGRAVMLGVALAQIAATTALLMNAVSVPTPIWLKLAVIAAGSSLVTLTALIVGRKFALRPIFENMPQLENWSRTKLWNMGRLAPVENSL